uniref:Extended synaptotagmin 2 n=1 Tax=Xiphophorus maculatus TaxID=8083 RepID=A0A3B5Q5R1_XIPMA
MEGTAGPGTRANGPVPAPNGNQVPPPPGPPLAPELEEEQPSSLTDVSQMWIKFAKTFAVIFPIYVLGYFEFSFSWVLIGLAMLFYWRKNHGSKDYRINRALAFLDHKDTAAKQSMPATELPPWVINFPFLSALLQTVKQMWPFICQFVDKLFRETIEPAVKGANPHLSTFCFTKIDMGDKPLRVNGVKVYTENVDKRQVIMDLQISFVGNTEIDIDIKKFYCRAGIKSIQLHGMLRVVMEPLLGDMPLIGALSVFFLKKPRLDINWTGLTNMLDIPGVNGLCDGLIQDIIYSYLVLPNRLNIPLVGAAELARIRFPIPEALVRIHFIEAQDLVGKDRFLGGLIKGKSDPYGVIQLGTQEVKSKVIKENLNPRWNEVYEDVHPDFPKGKLHLKMEWFCLLPSPEKLDQALLEIRADGSRSTDGLSSAVLIVFLDSARNLPSGKKVTSDPSPVVQFRVGHKSFDSKTKYKTNEPVWEENFTFLIHNPKKQELQVEVKDAKHECSLGTLALPLTRLLEAEDMTLSQRFPLKNAGPSCTLKMKMALRLLIVFFVHVFFFFYYLHQVLSLEKIPTSPSNSTPKPPPSISDVPRSSTASAGVGGGRARGQSLAETGKSTSYLAISGSQQFLNGGKEPTPSIASDISNPYAAQELHQRLQQLPNGSDSSHSPLGTIQLTIRYSTQRNRLIVVVHSCRNLIAFTDHGSNPYARLYLLPDKRRSGRRKTHTHKKTQNPNFDETFEFSVTWMELSSRNLDVAVKNSGGLLSKHKGLLGKVLVDLNHDDITKGLTQWYVFSNAWQEYYFKNFYFISYQ